MLYSYRNVSATFSLINKVCNSFYSTRVGSFACHIATIADKNLDGICHRSLNSPRYILFLHGCKQGQNPGTDSIIFVHKLLCFYLYFLISFSVIGGIPYKAGLKYASIEPQIRSMFSIKTYFH